MGHCCKCGKETPRVYAYCSGDVLRAKRPKTYTNVKERAAFLCTRCVMGYFNLCWALANAAYAIYAAVTMGNIIAAVILGIGAAVWIAVFVHALVVVLRDKALPFYVNKSQAEKRIVKLMRKQNPGNNYFAPSDYHNA